MEERQKLFEDWSSLAENIYVLNGIVQNPVDIPEDQITEWRNLAFKLWNDFRDLTGTTLKHLRENKRYDVYSHPESDSVWYEEHVEGNPYVVNDPLVEKILENVTYEEASLKLTELTTTSNERS